MNSQLVTQDGFPRSDINVIEIRNARVKIIKLRNDLNKVINELSEKMHTQFTSTRGAEKEPESLNSILFAKISEVVNNSPAAQAVSIFFKTAFEIQKKKQPETNTTIRDSKLMIKL